MRYISELDNKVFNTEQECLEHENAVRKSREEEFKRKEKLQMERPNRLDEIYKKDEELRKIIKELRKLIGSYKEDYGEYSVYYNIPFTELLKSIL